jgi:hypothetical protein
MTTVDGRHRPASSDCCPASIGLLSGLRRTAVRNQSDSLSAFIEMRTVEATAALIISAMLVGIAVAVNRRTRVVDLEKKEIDSTELRRWLVDFEIALQRHLDKRQGQP